MKQYQPQPATPEAESARAERQAAALSLARTLVMAGLPRPRNRVKREERRIWANGHWSSGKQRVRNGI